MMRTVKEISELTGISVRTIHYYDEIGLLKPTDKTAAGYRLYDERALEILQQIIFFREFDMPLKKIKAVMDNPSLDRNQILQMQRSMLVAEKKRMERLIASIDDILKGENKMDFEVFNKSEIEEMCQTTMNHMPDFLRETIEKEFGGMEAWRNHYIERASKPDMQKGYQNLVEWYGDKETALKVMNNPPSPQAGKLCEFKIEQILDKLIMLKDCPVNAPEVHELIGEYGLVMKEFSKIKYERGIMLSTASSYRDEHFKNTLEQKYGEGAAEFFAQAIEEYYKESEDNYELGTVDRVL